MPAPTRGPLPLRPTTLRVLLGAMALHGVLFTISEWAIADGAKAPWLHRYDAVAFLILHISSALALWSASMREELPPATRRGLRFFALAFTVLIAGSTVWFTMHLLDRPLEYISWADLIYYQYYPLLIVGAVVLPAVDLPRDRARDLLDWLVVALAFGSLIIVATNIEAQQAELTTFRRVMTLLSSAAQLVTLIALNRAIERARRIPSSAATLLLLGGVGVSTMGDLVAQILYSSGYEGPNFSRALAILANLAMVAASIRFLTDPIAPESGAAAPRSPLSPLPIVAVSAVAMVLVWMAGRGLVAGTGALFVGLVLLNLLLVVRDLRNSQAAARALQATAEREAARRLEALVRHASDGIILLDRDGRLLFASEPAERILGSRIGALEGRTLEQQLPESERVRWRNFLDDLRARPGTPASLSWRSPAPEGHDRLIETVGVDLRLEPAVRGIVINARDITERATLEERLRQAQKLEVVGRLAGGVAHDFNNVLTAILAGAELAQLELGPGNAAEPELEGIQGAAQRGAALTRRLLAFVRQEPVRPQRVPLGVALDELLPLLQRLAGETHQLSLRVEAGVGSVKADRAELEHIIFNLVANARDAMPLGGPIVIQAEVVDVAGPTPYAVIPPPDGRHVRIAVEDQGHGMTEEVRSRMFEPFFTQKSGGRGTGLGLIGVRPLVQGAGGGIAVETSSNGTRVSLYLPLLSDEPALEEPVTSPSSAVARAASRRSTPARGAATADAIRVLLVEDEPDVRDQLARLLDAQGFHALPVTSVEEARTSLASEPGVAAVVSDVMLPGETGLEFAQWLRRSHPRLPLLLISGHTGTELDRAARESEDLGLLRKPFTGAELADRLRLLLAASDGGQRRMP